MERDREDQGGRTEQEEWRRANRHLFLSQTTIDKAVNIAKSISLKGPLSVYVWPAAPWTCTLCGHIQPMSKTTCQGCGKEELEEGLRLTGGEDGKA